MPGNSSSKRSDTKLDTNLYPKGGNELGEETVFIPSHNSQALLENLSEDFAITSLDNAKNLFVDQDLATINEKRSLLEALWLYVGDTNVIEDRATQDIKGDITIALSLPVAHGLSDEDIKDAFPIVYKILFPESD